MTPTQRLLAVSIIVAAAPTAMLSFAYYAEHEMGLLPCILCLYQRPPHYAAAIAGLIALVFVWTQPGLSRAMLALAALALVIGAGIAVFHAGVEWKFWEGLAECGGTAAPLAMDVNDLAQGMKDAKIVQCDAAAWVFLGLSMAGWNALISMGLAAVAVWGIIPSPGRKSSFA